jgi:uncharacterized membrane protein
MKRYYEYKEEAERLMSGKYSTVIGTIIVFAVITGIPSSIADNYATKYRYDFETMQRVLVQQGNPALNFIFSVLTFIVTAMVAYSTASMYIDTANNITPMFGETLKKGFTESPGRTILHSFFQSLFISLWTLCLIIPGFIASYAYSMGFYIMNHDPSISSLDAVTESKNKMRGHKWQLFILDLSYLGWYLLGILTLGILWLWIVPKHQTAKTLFFNDIYYGGKVQAQPANFFPEVEE